jgi:hypothetical protein
MNAAFPDGSLRRLARGCAAEADFAGAVTQAMRSEPRVSLDDASGGEESCVPWPYLNTYFFQPIEFAGESAKFRATWHYASENRIFALYLASRAFEPRVAVDERTQRDANSQETADPGPHSTTEIQFMA